MDFEQIKNEILSEVASLTKSMLNDHKDEIVRETKEFLEESEGNLKSWTKAYTTGGIPRNEFELLVKTRSDLLKMKILTQEGISLVQVDNLRQGILDIIVKVASKAVL